MNSNLKLSLAVTMAVAGASVLVACGSDSSTSSKKKTAAVHDYKELPACTLKNDAEKATADDDDAIYVCKDRKWEILDTNFVANDTAKTLDDIPNCADEQDGNSYYIQKTGVNYICENERWEIVIAKEEESSSASKSDDKSSASKDDAKSSSATAKSSSSVTPSKTEGSSASKDDAKSSGSTAKSSSSVTPSKAEGSSASKDDDKDEGKVAATMDDVPNCTEKLESEIYHVTDKNADYICTENRKWEKVLVCGSKNYGSDSYFCSGGKAYEKCGTNVYDPAKEFCDAGTITELCGGRAYDTKKTTCIDGKAAYGKFDIAPGYVIVYTDGEYAYLDRWTSGDFTGYEGGCLFQAKKDFAEIEEVVPYMVGKSKEELLAMGGPGGLLLYYMFLSADNNSVDTDSCDYGYTVRSFRKIDEDFTEQEIIGFYAAFKTTMGDEHDYKEGDYKTCKNYDSGEKTTMDDRETQFCYQGVVYDRCGGSTFAASKVYNPEKNSCVDGNVVLKVNRTVENKKTVKHAMGDEISYSIGDSAYVDLIMYGDYLDREVGGCYAGAIAYGKEIEDDFSFLKDEGLLTTMPGINALSTLSKRETFVDSCDYYGRYTMKVKTTDEFTVSDFQTAASDFYALVFNELDEKHGVYVKGNTKCGDDAGAASVNVESQFCYKDAVYDRCGGSTFATSKVYDAADSSCVDGNVVLKVTAACGTGTYDLTKEFCFNGEVYANDNYEACKNSSGTVIAVAIRAHEVCEGEVVHQRCGDDHYSTSDETVFCSGDVLYSTKTHGECDGGAYELSTSFCYKVGDDDDGKVYPLCGGKTYTPRNGGDCIDGSYYYTADSKYYFDDLRDNNVYRYEVLTNGQAWMASDLVYAKSGRAGLNNSRLYTGTELENVCPSGWSVPSRSDYETLLLLADKDYKDGSSSVAGGKLKSSSGWGSTSYNGTDDYGLAFKPTGLASSSAADVSTTNQGFWWTSTDFSSEAYIFNVQSTSKGASLTTRVNNYYYAIRCLRDSKSAICGGHLFTKKETGVCLTNGNYVAMPEELYLVNDYVPMQEYDSEDGSFSGTANVTRSVVTALVEALLAKGFSKRTSGNSDGYLTLAYTKGEYKVTIKQPATTSATAPFEVTVTAGTGSL